MIKCSLGEKMTLQESFENIKDERIDRCKKHNLVDILNIHRQAKIKKLIKPLMSFRLRSHSLGVCFGQVKTEEKSNEITAIPELLDLLDLKGMIITIDAMGCQKKIVEKIAEKEAEYVISLKGNQQSIHRDVKEFFEHPCDDAYCQCYHIQRGEYTIEIGHGRIEKRTCYLCGDIDWLSEKDEWKILMALECSCAKER